MGKPLVSGLLLGTALCGGAWAQGSAAFDGQYVGELALAKVITGDCTQPAAGTAYPLTITGGQVSFKYVPRFDTALRGSVDTRGVVRAMARVPKGSVRMTGHIEGRELIAEIESPSCNYTFRASR